MTTDAGDNNTVLELIHFFWKVKAMMERCVQSIAMLKQSNDANCRKFMTLPFRFVWPLRCLNQYYARTMGSWTRNNSMEKVTLLESDQNECIQLLDILDLVGKHCLSRAGPNINTHNTPQSSQQQQHEPQQQPQQYQGQKRKHRILNHHTPIKFPPLSYHPRRKYQIDYLTAGDESGSSWNVRQHDMVRFLMNDRTVSNGLQNLSDAKILSLSLSPSPSTTKRHAHTVSTTAFTCLSSTISTSSNAGNLSLIVEDGRCFYRTNDLSCNNLRRKGTKCHAWVRSYVYIRYIYIYIYP
ncbi:unnamed protein product [Absidia cylindrospora]